MVREEARSWMPETPEIAFAQKGDPIVTASLTLQNRAVELFGSVKELIDHPSH
jgi:hypothetical protein